MQYWKDQTAPWHEPRSTESQAKQDHMTPVGGLAQTVYYILLTPDVSVLTRFVLVSSWSRLRTSIS